MVGGLDEWVWAGFWVGANTTHRLMSKVGMASSATVLVKGIASDKAVVANSGKPIPDKPCRTDANSEMTASSTKNAIRGGSSNLGFVVFVRGWHAPTAF